MIATVRRVAAAALLVVLQSFYWLLFTGIIVAFVWAFVEPFVGQR